MVKVCIMVRVKVRLLLRFGLGLRVVGLRFGLELETGLEKEGGVWVGFGVELRHS